MRSAGRSWISAIMLISSALFANAGSAPDRSSREAYRRAENIPFPASNPLTPEKTELGKRLFFDPRLSRAGDISCASCHAPDSRWSDARALPILSDGIADARRTPTVLNSAWMPQLMWDGRADSLEAQAVMPITTAHEMNFEMDALVERLDAIEGYRELFAGAFSDAAISEQRVAQALASFQRTLASNPSPFDAWVAGDDTAISETAKHGFAIFTGKAKCANCHTSWRFTDDGFHDIGLASRDLGRGAKTPPQLTFMQHAFKTPTLRDLDPGGPFMHDGSMRSLDEVIAHYEQGGVPRPSLSPEMSALTLSAEEKTALIEFIRTLDGGPLDVGLVQLPE